MGAAELSGISVVRGSKSERARGEAEKRENRLLAGDLFRREPTFKTSSCGEG